MARAPLNAMLLELPLHLAVVGFAASLMGLSGNHIHQVNAIKEQIQNGSYPDFVRLDTDGILMVDLAMLIIGAVQFAFSGLALLLSCEQLKKRRGEKSGKGTAAWLLVGLIQLVLLGAWAGLAGAYTAYVVQRMWSFTPGPNYAQPFDRNHAAYLREIDYFMKKMTNNAIEFGTGPGQTNVNIPLGVWEVSTLEQANAIYDNDNYLVSVTWKAAVALVWFELGTTFLVTVVHFALPFVWKALGLIREPKPDKSSRYNDLM